MGQLQDRAKRVAAADKEAEPVLDFINENWRELVNHAGGPVPPVNAISRQLGELFPELIVQKKMRQRIGLFVSSVLDEHGWELAKSDIRMADPFFKSGSIFRRTTPTSSSGLGDLFDRMARSMTETEAQDLMRALVAHHPQLKD
jgi:hypothetical protein